MMNMRNRSFQTARDPGNVTVDRYHVFSLHMSALGKRLPDGALLVPSDIWSFFLRLWRNLGAHDIMKIKRVMLERSRDPEAVESCIALLGGWDEPGAIDSALESIASWGLAKYPEEEP